MQIDNSFRHIVGEHVLIADLADRSQSVQSSLEVLRQNLESQVKILEEQISRIPQVQRGLDALQRDYVNTTAKYREIKSKQLQAELSQSLERDQKGERLAKRPAFQRAREVDRERINT